MKTKINYRKVRNSTISKKTLLLFTGLLLIGSITVTAQIGLPGGDPNIPDAPIDGLLSIGLIAGACIGLRKRIKGLKE